jgi:signal transduction histidine kinase
MHEEAVRLSRLVDDLLTLTRLDAGQQLQPEDVQVRPFLEQFTERYASAWPNRRIKLDLEELDGASTRIDPDALRRIVTNLIDNAARYSAPGKPITVGGAAVGESVTVSVGDEGPGLSPEDAAHVFERFYRGTKSRSRNSGGTGLGLSIVHALVEESGGHVNIDTGPDRGTIISVELPQTPAPPSAV